MTPDMIDNITNKNNIQYFMDVTYYATPPNNKKFKLLIILAFNNNLYKTLLWNISLICNENKETFISVLNYLKNRYNFILSKITIDYPLSELNAIQYIYPNIIIIPCFFHFIQNICKKIPDIKSKNKTLKSKSKDC